MNSKNKRQVHGNKVIIFLNFIRYRFKAKRRYFEPKSTLKGGCGPDRVHGITIVHKGQ